MRTGGDHKNGAVCTHGQRRAQRLLRLLHADRNSNDLVGLAGFFKADRFFHRNLVERVHRHFDIGEINTATVRFHADLHIVVNHAFDRHQYLHCSAFSSKKRQAAKATPPMLSTD